MPITSYELRITHLKSAFRFSVVLGVICVLARNSFGQEALLEKPPDFVEQSEILSRLITSGTTEQKRDALSQIRNLEIEAASRLAVPALRDDSEIVRVTATAAVVFLPTDEAAQSLIPLLADKKPLVRREAAYALGKISDSNAINSLLQILQKDKILEVRNAAIVALGEIGDVSAVPELVKILQRKSQAKEEFARRSAARSIGQIAQIIQTGKVMVLTPANFLPERFKLIEVPKYSKLPESLPQFHPAINLLIEVLRSSKESPDVKREAAFALGAIGDESAIAVLQFYTNDADYYLAEICRESLRKIAAASSR